MKKLFNQSTIKKTEKVIKIAQTLIILRNKKKNNAQNVEAKAQPFEDRVSTSTLE